MKFLKALQGLGTGRPPVWLMRQAGRYLPEYRKLRQKHSLKELFFTPELAAEITLLPIDLLGFDAAILFSDITVIALALGLKLDFNEGPVIKGEKLYPLDVREVLSCVAETILLVKPRLKVPLIGFCGGPFTVASYLIEKHSGTDLPLTKKMMHQDPKAFHHLLDLITAASIDYLQMQKQAGVDAIQIFDSWAHVLSKEDFDEFCAPYLKRLPPSILFMRGSSFRAKELSLLNPLGISFDWQVPLPILRAQVPKKIAIQGNLDPDLLYAPLPIIEKKVKALLDSMRGDPGFIVNLGHGVKPDVPVDAVRCLVEAVKAWQ